MSKVIERTINVGPQMRLISMGAPLKPESVEADYDLRFPFASETPVRMAAQYLDGQIIMEILDHGPGADHSELVASGMFLYVHDMTRPMARIVRAWVNPDDRRSWCDIKWLTNADATNFGPDIQSGNMPNVSVGYIPKRVRFEGELNGLELWRLVAWSSYEVSSMPIAADGNVGIGRGAALERPCVVENKADTANSEVVNMNPQLPAPAGTPVAVDEVAIRASITRDVQERSKKIMGIARENGLPQLGETAIADGHDVSWLYEQITKSQREKFTLIDTGSPATLLDMSKKDKKKFSVLSGFRQMFLGEKAGFETECHNELADRLDKPRAGQGQVRSLLVPYDIQMDKIRSPAQQRGMNTGTLADGGAMVQTQYGDMIELLRNKTRVGQLGATVLPGLIGDFEAPRQTAAGSVSWVGEGSNGTASAPSTGLFKLAPHTAIGLYYLTRRLLLQTGRAAEEFARNDLINVLRIEWDRVALLGSGYNGEPLGLFNHTGIGAVTFSSALTWDNCLELESDVASANADDASLALLTTNAVRRIMKKLVIDAGSGQFAWDRNTDKVNGYPSLTTEQLSQKIAFGDWKQLVIGEWGVMEFAMDASTDFNSGGSRIRAMQDIDVNVRQVGAFSTMAGVSA